MKHKVFSFLNVTGLAIGMAGAMILLFWIQNQLSIDRFHDKENNLFKVYANRNIGGQVQTTNSIPYPLFTLLQRNFPEIRNTTRIIGDQKLFQYEENRLSLEGNIVDASFLDMFSFPLIQGEKASVLRNPDEIVITERTAKLFFRNANPMNKILKANAGKNYIIKGVLKDLPNNTQFNFNYLVAAGVNVSNNNPVTAFVELVDHADPEAVNRKLASVSSPEKFIMFAYPLKKLWLQSDFENGKPSGGIIDLIYFLGLIAGIILLIACINFMNLSTARSIKRAKEVGVRKVLGGSRRLLIYQFMGESVFLSFIAGMVALGLVSFALPSFNSLTGKQLVIEFTSVYFWIAFGGFVFCTGIIAGSYPAFFLSSFKPAKVLKGIFEQGNMFLTPRKVLFVFQFIVAVVLINFTILLQKQVRHTQDRETGFVKQDLLFHSITKDIAKAYDVLSNELLQSVSVIALSASDIPVTMGGTSHPIQWEGQNEQVDFQIRSSDRAYIETNGLTLLAGRDIDLAQFPGDTASCLINESAITAIGFKKPIGKLLKDGSNDYRVVGTIKDFITSSPLQAVEPLLVRGSHNNHYLNIRLNPAHTQTANLSKVSTILKAYNPNFLTELKFADEQYTGKIKGLLLTARLINIFAAIAIFIACLGLLGLVMFAAESRSKEISIRKVFGANPARIVLALSQDFIRMVITSIVVASPIAWILMNAFLRPLHYRVDISIWILFGSAATALLITIVTIGSQVIKSATTNPIKDLRAD
ncbi:MAG: ABC transporter permease [Bacteroidota bacterium]